MTIEITSQIIKSRDDAGPVYFERKEGPTDDKNPFVLSKESDCSWVKKDEEFGPTRLRPRIEPWLTALCQSEHLSLLLGSGLSLAVSHLAECESDSAMSARPFGEYDDLISKAATKSARLAGRGSGNLEDKIRAGNELLRGLEILSITNGERGADAESLRTQLHEVLAAFAASILNEERDLITAPGEARERAFNYLVSFLMSFASRTGTRDRLHVFTTNYDRLIEAGADIAGLHLLDRFVGNLAPVFRSSRLDVDMHYNPPGIRGEPRYLEGVARFTKLHGSLDWVDCGASIRRVGVPFGANEIHPYLDAPGTEGADAMRLMIYPNAAKDRETSAHPYVELFRDLAAAICRPNHTLFTFGYGFGDEHINRVIKDMLTIPSAHLVAISRSDRLGRIMTFYEQLGRHAQVSLLIGDHVGDFQVLVDHYLPKPAIDRTTFRMAELLKARWAAVDAELIQTPTESPSIDGDQA